MQPPTSAPLIDSPYVRSLLAGGLAGTTVDLSLYPLDTLKTRLQSSTGFLRSGGFSGIYKGVGSAIVGSAPGAALFFVTYDGVKRALPQDDRSRLGPAGVHMLAASLGEIAACAVRVPTEVVKQRAQANQHKSSLAALQHVLGTRHTRGYTGLWRELYRGWSITVMREVPFTMIQFPLWEGLKSWAAARRKSSGSQAQVTAGESALFGSISGAVAAGLTTPLDVLKTRMMLAEKRIAIGTLVDQIWRIEGGRAFFAGLGPRTFWISAGGAIFLGSYQWAANQLGGGTVEV